MLITSNQPGFKKLIQNTFQGEIEIEDLETNTKKIQQFFFLSLDIPMISVFKDKNQAETVIAQIPIQDLL